MIHNQTLVRRRSGVPHYKDKYVEEVKNLHPVITEHYDVTLYNEKSKQSEIIAENKEMPFVFITDHTTSFHHFLIDYSDWKQKNKIIFLPLLRKCLRKK